jgi:hypothetical protein
MAGQKVVMALFVCTLMFLMGCAAQVAPESSHPEVINELPPAPAEDVQKEEVVVNETVLAKPLAPKCGDGICNGVENCDRCYDDCACKSPAECYQGKCKVPECGGVGDCNDKDPCTVDTCEFEQHPNAYCSHEEIKKLKNNDGCCPKGMNSELDTDCEAVCGNDICEAGETTGSCDEDCPEVDEPAVCGNGICESGEDKSSCDRDCTR